MTKNGMYDEDPVNVQILMRSLPSYGTAIKHARETDTPFYHYMYRESCAVGMISVTL
jgi:hypothetical protein